MRFLPCPFCGSNDLEEYSDSMSEYYKIHSEFIICKECGSKSKNTVWNTRHSPLQSPKETE